MYIKKFDVEYSIGGGYHTDGFYEKYYNGSAVVSVVFECSIEEARDMYNAYMRQQRNEPYEYRWKREALEEDYRVRSGYVPHLPQIVRTPSVEAAKPAQLDGAMKALPEGKNR